MTAAQVRQVVERIRQAGQHRPGDPDILVVFDAGYDVTRLAYLLTDLPVELVGRVRSDRVFHFPAQPKPARSGVPPNTAPSSRWPTPPPIPNPTSPPPATPAATAGPQACAWQRLHPRLDRRSAWRAHDGELPIIEGTLIRLTVDRLPGDRDPKPVWLWSSRPHTESADVDRLWRMFLRRFDIEHTFRFLKQTLGWTRPRVRTPKQADRWTWLIIAAHTQLRLARDLAEDLRRPWEKPATESRGYPGAGP